MYFHWICLMTLKGTYLEVFFGPQITGLIKVSVPMMYMVGDNTMGRDAQMCSTNPCILLKHNLLFKTTKIYACSKGLLIIGTQIENVHKITFKCNYMTV